MLPYSTRPFALTRSTSSGLAVTSERGMTPGTADRNPEVSSCSVCETRKDLVVERYLVPADGLQSAG